MIEGSGSRSVPCTNGSGSMRPKNTRIRIRNTAFDGIRIFMFIFVDLLRHSRRLLVLFWSRETAHMKYRRSSTLYISGICVFNQKGFRNIAKKIGPGPEDCFSVTHPLSIRYRIPTVEKFSKPTLVSGHFRSIGYW